MCVRRCVGQEGRERRGGAWLVVAVMRVYLAKINGKVCSSNDII